MARNVPDPDTSATDDEWHDINEAELEAAQDDAERAKQKNRSVLVGGLVVLALVVLTAFGIYNGVVAGPEPAPPGVSQQMPSAP